MKKRKRNRKTVNLAGNKIRGHSNSAILNLCMVWNKATASHRRDSEITDEALTCYLASDRHYVSVLSERISAADSGDFADEASVERFFADYAT